MPVSLTVTDLDHLLLLLYVANDVLQNGRRRGAEVFHELFKQPLKEVFKLVRWVRWCEVREGEGGGVREGGVGHRIELGQRRMI